MPFWGSSFLALVLIALPFPLAVSAEDASSTNHLAGNPLIGTWRSVDRGWGNSRASVTFVTFREDGRYQVRLYRARLPGPATGAHIIAGTYEITGPGRFVFRAQETFACPTGSNCVPHQVSAQFYEPQSITFRFDGPDRLVDGDGVVWSRMR